MTVDYNCFKIDHVEKCCLFAAFGLQWPSSSFQPFWPLTQSINKTFAYTQLLMTGCISLFLVPFSGNSRFARAALKILLLSQLHESHNVMIMSCIHKSFQSHFFPILPLTLSFNKIVFVASKWLNAPKCCRVIGWTPLCFCLVQVAVECHAQLGFEPAGCQWSVTFDCIVCICI